MHRIEICGGIATGKTTLAEQIAAAGKITLVREVFEEVPFWKKFYENPVVYEFSKNISFLLFHADCLRTASASPNGAVCDFAFLQDMSYAAISPRRQQELPILRAIHGHLAKSIAPPSAIVHLYCSTQTQLQRIRGRGRQPEQSIGARYLEDLNGALENDLRTLKASQGATPLIYPIDTDEVDILKDRDAAGRIYADLMRRIDPAVTPLPT
jgi:deoxyadenosine/deoxycytidine kinase